MIEMICYVVFVGQVLEEYLTQLKPPQNRLDHSMMLCVCIYRIYGLHINSQIYTFFCVQS